MPDQLTIDDVLSGLPKNWRVSLQQSDDALWYAHIVAHPSGETIALGKYHCKPIDALLVAVEEGFLWADRQK